MKKVRNNNIFKRYIASFVFVIALMALSPVNKNTPRGSKWVSSSLNPEEVLRLEEHWIDSMLQTLSLEQKIGQLFMIRAHSNLGADHIRKVEAQIQKYGVGGLCFFQGTAQKQLELTSKYQALSKVPLLISMDGEWGLGMRLKDDVIVYPRNLMLGAINNNQLLYDYGQAHAAQFRRIGVHINFGPVIDINNNPKNPVINDRSFGEDKYNVVTKGYLYMLGLQDGQVMACGKHFPGHGDTQVDSHYDLPVISHSRERLQELELFPFDILCDNGLQSIMVAHVHVPALDPTPNMPTSLSSAVVDTLLRQQMKYDGLVFTDGLEMKGVTKYFKPGDIEVRALLAGNDVLLLPEDIDLAFSAIKNAILTGELTEQRINQSVRRILKAKFQLIVNAEPVNYSTQNLYKDLNLPEYHVVKEQIIAEALTLVKDNQRIVPIAPMQYKEIVFLHVGCDSIEVFTEQVAWYTAAKHLRLPADPTAAQVNNVLESIPDSSLLIVTIHAKKRVASANYGVDEASARMCKILHAKFGSRMLLALFGNPYGLKFFEQLPCLIAAYEDDAVAYRLMIQALFGARSFAGRLPVGVSETMRRGAGLSSPLNASLRHSLPESEGMRSSSLAKIDTIIAEMIKIKAAPGCQIIAIKDQSVVFNKSYGTHTYDKGSPLVKTSDMYDIASITKVASATLAVMKLYEDGLLNLDAQLVTYLPMLKGSDKEKITMRDVLLHKAGLTPYIPFYKQTVSKKNKNSAVVQDSAIYSSEMREGYLQVAENLWIRPDYADTMLQVIMSNPLNTDKSYRYSDLGFILIPYLVKSLSGQDFETYLKKHFYTPLGMQNTCFNPLEKGISPERIVPTEKDTYFRNQLLQGYVHDMAAAMFGGVSGHAGLFSTAADLARLFSMLVNGGFYQGRRYLKQETVDLFTTRPEGESRRGLGFDMVQLQKGKPMNATGLASARTFGHTGFTGTCIWADPECGIIYVFLSNRVHPTMENSKINDYQYRIRVHYALYKSMDE